MYQSDNNPTIHGLHYYIVLINFRINDHVYVNTVCLSIIYNIQIEYLYGVLGQ